ncbi:MAG TPA: hypothetical protein DHW50_05980 [Akkermansia sp.]|uniref:Uncharacterized protein n=1 Tax=Akkermansia massiliensis TaxID=2927224 RepID=A0AAE6W1N8_9BACT|nr:hypothetical protein CXU18_11455 [Akkermansia muciniphila]QHV63508.1 hypothetical protein DMI76_09105 [Akkermansia massiliensis]HCL33196.1 hypothetical protein [Akkermansia sp.]PNC48970.1 hypothetical protein CXU15_10310 [Akkermansia muciniphila]PNC50789.1 hypothetical protein CXU11_01880 [Akkermansia muciniphila]
MKVEHVAALVTNPAPEPTFPLVFCYLQFGARVGSKRAGINHDAPALLGWAQDAPAIFVQGVRRLQVGEFKFHAGLFLYSLQSHRECPQGID